MTKVLIVIVKSLNFVIQAWGKLLMLALLDWGAEIQKINIIYEVKINITAVQV